MLLRQFLIPQRLHGVNSFGPPFASCSFIFAFGVPSTSPVTEAVAVTGADLWFVTAEGNGKLRSLEADPHINLSYKGAGALPPPL